MTTAAKDQLSKLWHTTHIYMHPQVHEYAEKLTSHLPGDLKVCHGCDITVIVIVSIKFTSCQLVVVSLGSYIARCKADGHSA